MAQYTIRPKAFLGMSHCGEMSAYGCGTIELNDDEVKTLAELINKYKSADVEVMGLETATPELFQKLDQACCNIAYEAEEEYWLMEGFENGYYEYDEQELMEYCKLNCGYEYPDGEVEQIDEEDIQEADCEWDESWANEIELEDESAHFQEWLLWHLHSLSHEEMVSFCREHMNAEVDMGEAPQYEVVIPVEVYDMSELAKSEE